VAKSSADSLLTLINAILDFSKIEAGKLELAEVEFDLATAVEEVVEMFAQRCEKKGLLLACHIDPAVRYPTKGDPDRLRQVLVNLINNAVKFTERGEIVVRVTLDGESADRATVRFSVADSGIGIPADQMGRLFKSFSQVDASTTRKYGGTGLGLAISKQLAELMGGSIGVESSLGRGSTFWFTATLIRPPHAVRWIKPSVDPRALKVLVIDENPVHREVLAAQLGSWGLKAATVSQGAEALDLFAQASRAGEAFTAVVMSGTIRDMAPDALARAIRPSAKSGTPAMMLLTDLGAPVESSDLASRGFDGHIPRPVRQSQLFDTLMEAAARAVSPSTAQGKSQQAATPDQQFSTDGARILLVEDNEVNRMVAVEVLTEAGLDCEYAADGKRAVEAVLKSPFDLVLMDCQMPEMDGFEATRVIRRHESEKRLPKRASRLPIIALTANALKGDRERCLEAGMDDYLTKPLRPEKLLGMIRLFLGRAQSAGASVLEKTLADKRPVAHESGSETAQPQAAVEVPVDFEPLVYRCKGNRDFAGKVLEKFRIHSVETLEGLVRGFKEKDGELAIRSAHTLKGMAAMVSAEALRRSAAETEARSKAGDWDAVERQLQTIRGQLDSAIAFIDQMIPPAGQEAAAVKPLVES
jgi:Amt family ammonium transporter